MNFTKFSTACLQYPTFSYLVNTEVNFDSFISCSWRPVCHMPTSLDIKELYVGCFPCLLERSMNFVISTELGDKTLDVCDIWGKKKYPVEVNFN